MPLYATSCYQATVTNIASSSVTTNIGSLYASRRWCNLIIGGPVSTGGGSGGTARVSFQVTNTGGVPTTDAYSVRIQPRADSNPAEEPLVTLNGLPPGNAVHGDLVLGPDESALIAVDAGFLEPRAFRFYDVVLSLDEDGDGIAEDVATGGVTFGPSTSIVGVPPVDPLPGTLSLGITPNPVRSNATIHYTLPSKGRVELALFDVAGRQVRSVPSFYAEAGNGALTLNCRGLSRGVYFVRLRVNGNAAGQRFLMLE